MAELWERKSQAQAAAGLAELCGRKNPEDVATMLAFSQLLQQQKAPALANGLLARYGKNTAEARQAMLEILKKRVKTAWPAWQLDPAKQHGLTMDDTGLLTLSLQECTEVAGLGPLEGMAIRSLNVAHCRSVRDLSPLRGMPLTSLELQGTSVEDLSPLAGMRLTSLGLSFCAVTDFSPLRGMPLTSLSLAGTRLQDLSLLKGMPLTSLDLGNTSVGDLSPLRGMPLNSLDVFDCGNVRDLSPLVGMPLTYLRINGAVGVTDLSQLQGMELSAIRFDTKVTKGVDVLRRMKSLTNINDLPAEEFWKKYDAEQPKK